MRRILLLATLVVACGGETHKPAEQVPTPAVEATLPAQPVATSSDAGEPPPANNCVEECVASRQMQATSPEQIQQDCEARCSEDPTTSIDAPASDAKAP